MYGGSSIRHSSAVSCGVCVVCGVWCRVCGVGYGGDACVVARQSAPPPLYFVVCAWCVVCDAGCELWGLVVMRVWQLVNSPLLRCAL